MSEIVREHNAAYAASKGGIRQLTKALAVEWADRGIHVNAIGPGYIRTELTRPLWEKEDFDAWVKKRTPLGRWGTPEDLGNAAVFLASPASDYITGHVLYVEGGFLSSMGPVF
jgi:gluconate 5-dehydrogenase